MLYAEELGNHASAEVALQRLTAERISEALPVAANEQWRTPAEICQQYPATASTRAHTLNVVVAPLPVCLMPVANRLARHVTTWHVPRSTSAYRLAASTRWAVNVLGGTSLRA